MRTLLTAILLGCTAGTPARCANSLYDQLGAAPGVHRIVDATLRRYYADPRLHDDFDNINQVWLQPRFETFICHVTDGPCQYRGRSMAASHRGLHITQARFNAVVEDLQDGMDDAGVPFRLQNRLLARLAPMERDIVTR
nr:group 1 truncated hemoglobin [uncultured Lichenicoccus sp.]